MTYCAVKGCHNSSHKHHQHLKISFHAFPSDPIVAALWVEKLRLNRKESFWDPSKTTKICSVHFDESVKYVTKGGLCKLSPDAVPTKDLHIYCSEEMQKSNIIKKENVEVVMEVSCKEEEKSSNLETPLSSQQEQLVHRNEGQEYNILISRQSVPGIDSISESLEKAALRRKLAKKILLQRKHTKIIKTLQQKVRRLKRKNLSLKKSLVNLRKKRLIDNDVFNIFPKISRINNT